MARGTALGFEEIVGSSGVTWDIVTAGPGPQGRLKLHIGRTFPLAQAAEAHRYLESRQSTGKLILMP